MAKILNEYELRVLGALVEKQVATPDYYPMTINALVNACNQKNHRDPVVSFDEGTVVKALDSLREKNLAYIFHGSDARVPKYGHLFHKAYDLSVTEVALMCVLILRGPQTPGELRSRTSHLHQFENLPEVESLLNALSLRQEPLVVKLPRQHGSRESRFAHLLGGDIELDEIAVPVKRDESKAVINAEQERLRKLEDAVAELQQEIVRLRDQFEKFKTQFD